MAAGAVPVEIVSLTSDAVSACTGPETLVGETVQLVETRLPGVGTPLVRHSLGQRHR